MSPQPQKKQGKRRSCSCWLAVAALLAVGLGLLVVVWVVSGRAQLRRATAKLEAAGIPTTIEELVPPVPDTENAAILYEKAWKRLGAIPPDIKDLFAALRKSPPEEWSRGQKERLETYVEGHREAIELCRQGAKRSECRFRVDYMALPGPPIDHVVAMGSLVQLLALDCFDGLAKGDSAAAVDSAFLGMALARDCAADPFLIGKLTQFGNYRISYKGLDHTLRYGNLSVPQLESLLPRLRKARPEADMTTTLNAEMCWTLALFRDPNRADAAWIYESLFADRDGAHYIELTLRCIEHAADPYYKAKKEFQLIEIEAAKRSWMHPVSSVTAFGLTVGANEPASAAQARHELRRLAVALMIHQRERGAFPGSLSTLAPRIIPEIPIDPFSGRPYMYRREGGSLVVYSLGKDMQDDNAMPRQAGSDKGDIVFRFAAKP